jgi:hypothetical protein
VKNKDLRLLFQRIEELGAMHPEGDRPEYDAQVDLIYDAYYWYKQNLRMKRITHIKKARKMAKKKGVEITYPLSIEAKLPGALKKLHGDIALYLASKGL